MNCSALRASVLVPHLSYNSDNHALRYWYGYALAETYNWDEMLHKRGLARRTHAGYMRVINYQTEKLYSDKTFEQFCHNERRAAWERRFYL